jgi:hypothetical protein
VVAPILRQEILEGQRAGPGTQRAGPGNKSRSTDWNVKFGFKRSSCSVAIGLPTAEFPLSTQSRSEYRPASVTAKQQKLASCDVTEDVHPIRLYGFGYSLSVA